MVESIATVDSNVELAPGYRLLTLSFDQEIRCRAGQFAMVRARHLFEPLLRRALAIYKVGGPRQLSFLYQVLGRGTQALAQLGPGDEVEALVPLGNSWLEDRKSHPALPRSAIVVAGGIGSASVLMLCEGLARARVETQIVFGAANGGAARGCGLEDFRALGLPITVTTDDGSLGERGFVTAPFERILGEGAAGLTVYTCGPWAMMSRVAEIAARFRVDCLASLEAPMGCGFGVCVGCVVAVKGEQTKSDETPGYGSYQRVCTDGPVFPAEMIRWEISAMAH